LGKAVVGGGLEPNQDQIAHANSLRRIGGLGSNMKVAFRTVNVNAVRLDYRIVRATQEMHLMAGAAQFSAVKTAHSAAAHHTDLHGH
jgi:hypothetical protein